MFILCLSYISRSGIKSFVLVSQRFGYVRVFVNGAQNGILCFELCAFNSFD